MSKRKKGATGFNVPFSDVRLPSPPPTPPPEDDRIASQPPASGATDEPSPEALFCAATEGVVPLSDRDAKVSTASHPRRRPTGEDDEALALQELTRLVRGEGPFRIFDAEEVLSGLAPGVSFEILKKLRRGQYAYRRHLDLHGCDREQARAALAHFISTARRDAERCVLVVTGRGRRSPGGVSVLRETVPRWLSRAPLRPHVLAFCTARAVDGGPGAFYVLLRRAGVRPFGAKP